jgi:hypothetical protein
LRTISSDLPPDGVAIVSTPNRLSEQSANPHHEREYTRDEFSALLENHFGSVNLFFQWSYPYPLDAPLSLRDLARGIVPVKLKHQLKGELTKFRGTDPSEPPGETIVAPGTAATYRPLPASYLSLLPPGFRYGPPAVWVAVCSAVTVREPPDRPQRLIPDLPRFARSTAEGGVKR